MTGIRNRTMHYQTQYRIDPTPQQAHKLRQYVGGGDAEIVLTESGLEASTDDLMAFAKGAERSTELRQHTVSMAEEHDPEELVEQGRQAAKEALDGNFVVSVHAADDVNPHLHIAEFVHENRGSDFAITPVRESLENYIDDPTAW